MIIGRHFTKDSHALNFVSNRNQLALSVEETLTTLLGRFIFAFQNYSVKSKYASLRYQKSRKYGAIQNETEIVPLDKGGSI